MFWERLEMSGFRDIYIANNCYLSLKNNRLCVNDTESIPLEDINCIIVEGYKSKVSAMLLSAVATYNIVLIICDNKYLPCSFMMPFNKGSHALNCIKAQISCPTVLNKQLWQSIVKAKIQNQSDCLSSLNLPGTEHLLILKNKVCSFDSTNHEAVAAKYYFLSLFGKEFKRRDNCTINLFLNFMYAIIRGIIARQLVYHGFETILGIKHISDDNTFNLADDLIEPFRGIADYYAYKYFQSENITIATNESLSFEMKQYIIQVQYLKVLIKPNYESVIDSAFDLNEAADLVIVSYKKSLLEHKNLLVFPKLLII